MGGCRQILAAEAMSRASFMVQLNAEQQETRNLVPCQQVLHRTKVKPHMKLFGQITYFSNIISAFDMVYQFLQVWVEGRG